MSTAFQLRRQAEEFAARVDAPAGSPVDARFDRLLDVVGELRRQGELVDADPRPEFTAALRSRLVAEAGSVMAQQEDLSIPPVRQRSHPERRLVVAATVAVIVGGSAGMAAAAEHSLPGEALYPVKRVIENVQVGTATSAAVKGGDLLSQAGGRLEEVRDLLDSHSGANNAQVPGTLAQFQTQALAGADELMASYRDTGDPTTIATIRRFASRSMSTLAALSGAAPAEDQPALRTSEATVRDIDERASGLCQDCSSLPALELPALHQPTTLSITGGVRRALVRADRVGGVALDSPPVLSPTGLPTPMLTEAVTPTPSQPLVVEGSVPPSASESASAASPTTVTDSTNPTPSVTDSPESATPTPDPTVTATEEPTDSGDPSASVSADPSSSASEGSSDSVLPEPSPPPPTT